MTAKEVLENLISTIEKNSTDNKATITNVDLWVKSWREESKQVNNSVLDGVIVSQNCHCYNCQSTNIKTTKYKCRDCKYKGRKG